MLEHAHIQPKPLTTKPVPFLYSLSSMASTLSSNLSSDHKYYPNATYFAPQEQLTRSNVNPMYYGLTMWLGQEDCFLPFSSNFGCLDDFILSGNTNNDVISVDCSSNSSSLMDVQSFGTSGFDYYSSQSNGHTNTSGSTYDEFESNVYSTLQSYVPSTTNNYVATPECWGFEGHTTQVTGSENSSTKVGRYSAEERKDRILRYLKKRNQRNFRKTIKYACRKTLADRRIRIRGRFAKNQEEESVTNYDQPMTQDNNVTLPFHNADNKIEQCGDFSEEWVQEAMSSLLYVPYLSSWHPDRTTSFLSI